MQQQKMQQKKMGILILKAENATFALLEERLTPPTTAKSVAMQFIPANSI